MGDPNGIPYFYHMKFSRQCREINMTRKLSVSHYVMVGRIVYFFTSTEGKVYVFKGIKTFTQTIKQHGTKLNGNIFSLESAESNI